MCLMSSSFVYILDLSLYLIILCLMFLIKGNIEKNCLCVTVVCTIIMVHKGTSSCYRLVDCIVL